jgi:hypothetical protein
MALRWLTGLYVLLFVAFALLGYFNNVNSVGTEVWHQVIDHTYLQKEDDKFKVNFVCDKKLEASYDIDSSKVEYTILGARSFIPALLIKLGSLRASKCRPKTS